jgi:hypothetical protein
MMRRAGKPVAPRAAGIPARCATPCYPMFPVVHENLRGTNLCKRFIDDISLLNSQEPFLMESKYRYCTLFCVSRKAEALIWDGRRDERFLNASGPR